VAIEIVSILSSFLPSIIKKKLNTYLGVKDDADKS
jgi:hypothetical protein